MDSLSLFLTAIPGRNVRGIDLSQDFKSTGPQAWRDERSKVPPSLPKKGMLALPNQDEKLSFSFWHLQL